MKKFLKISELKSHEIIPGFMARFIHNDKMSVSYCDIKKGKNYLSTVMHMNKSAR